MGGGGEGGQGEESRVIGWSPLSQIFGYTLDLRRLWSQRGNREGRKQTKICCMTTQTSYHILCSRFINEGAQDMREDACAYMMHGMCVCASVNISANALKHHAYAANTYIQSNLIRSLKTFDCCCSCVCVLVCAVQLIGKSGALFIHLGSVLFVYVC